MGQYEYHAESSDGRETFGKMAAASEDAARRELASRGLRVVDITLSPSSEDVGGLRQAEQDLLLQTVASAAASRIPLEVSLAALAVEKGDRRLAAAAERLAARLQQGGTIKEAVDSLDHQLPTEVAGLLRAGVESGDLAGSFERFAQQRLAAERFNRRIRSAFAYPLLILFILVPLLLFLSIFVIPMFGDIYREFDLELPPITEVILQTARQMPMLVLGLLLLFAVPFILRIVGGRWLVHRVRFSLPLVGRLWMWAGQREFSSQLSSFLSLGLPMPSAIAYTTDVLSDRNVARACERVRNRVEEGETLSRSLDQSIHFDRSLVALVGWGEKHGALPEALGVATDLFDDHVEQQASLVRRVLPPLALVTVATLMFFVIVGLMVPMVKLIEGLSK
jgi:type IV pilus assembly protein PilC